MQTLTVLNLSVSPSKSTFKSVGYSEFFLLPGKSDLYVKTNETKLGNNAMNLNTADVTHLSDVRDVILLEEVIISYKIKAG